MKNIILGILFFVSGSSVAQTYVLDETFGTNGVVNGMPYYQDLNNSLSINNQAYFLSGSRILKVAENGDLNSFIFPLGTDYIDFKYIGDHLYLFGKTYQSPRKAFIAKMDLNFNLINNFGQNGISVLEFGSSAGVRDIILTADGNLLCSGQMYIPNSGTDYNLLLFKIDSTNGNLITGTNQDGFVQYSPSLVGGIGSFSGGFIADYNSSFLLIGNVFKSGASHLAILNVDDSGNLISSFGTGGYKSVSIENSWRTECRRVRFEDNKIYCNYNYYMGSFYEKNKLAAYDLNSDQLTFTIEEGLGGIGSFKIYDDGIFTTKKNNEQLIGTDKFIIGKKLNNGQSDTNFHINGYFSYDSPNLISSTYDGNGADRAQEIVKLDNGDILIGGQTKYVYYISPNYPFSQSVYNGITIIKITPGEIELGVETNANKTNTLLYPNPFSVEINLKLKIPVLKIEIYNSVGQKIEEPKFKYENESTVIDLSDILIKGIYLLKVYTVDGKSFSEKIIRE